MQHYYTIIIIVGLLLFSIFRRVRRNIGWQPLELGKLRWRTAIFFIIGLLFLIEGAFHPISLLSDAVGILVGTLLAYYGAGMTRFEQRDNRWYYRPNTWIGSMVIVIFFARLLYRFYEMYLLTKSGGLQGAQAGSLKNMGYDVGNPWTAGLLIIMFAYYVTYYIYLLRNQKHLSQSGQKTD